jgi:hypothetical protein
VVVERYEAGKIGIFINHHMTAFDAMGMGREPHLTKDTSFKVSWIYLTKISHQILCLFSLLVIPANLKRYNQ